MPSTPSPTIEEVDQLNEKAAAFISGEDPKQMLELGEMACDLARRISYKKGEAYGLVYTGFARWFLSDHSAAVEKLTAAQSLFEQLDDRTGHTRALLPLMSVQKNLGTYDQSLSNNLEALKYFRETGDTFWECLSLLALQTLYFDVGDYAKCIHHCEKTIRAAETIGEQWMVARALVHMGSAHRSRGDDEEAATCFDNKSGDFRSGGQSNG